MPEPDQTTQDVTQPVPYPDDEQVVQDDHTKPEAD